MTMLDFEWFDLKLILGLSRICNLQDPAEADKLLKIQRELDETKIILVSAVSGPFL